MKRVAMMWRVKRDAIDYYKKRHLNPPSEVVKIFQEYGFHNFSVFLVENIAFMYAEIEGNDLSEQLAKVHATDISKKWESEMDPLKEEEAIPGCGAKSIELEQIWFVE